MFFCQKKSWKISDRQSLTGRIILNAYPVIWLLPESNIRTMQLPSSVGQDRIILLPGNEITVLILSIRCKCQQEIFEQEEAQRKLHEKQMEIEHLKTSGLQDKALYDYLNVEDPDVFSHRAWKLEYQREQEMRQNQPARTKKSHMIWNCNRL